MKLNELVMVNKMKHMPLTKGQFAIVDNDMFDYLNQWKWYALEGPNTYYAIRTINKTSSVNRSSVLMHRFILDLGNKNNTEVDHIDGNGLNNQRDNLRVVTTRQNQGNSRNHRAGRLVGTTQVHKKVGSKIYIYWYAQIIINGKKTFLGSFKTEQEAHDVYIKALKGRTK